MANSTKRLTYEKVHSYISLHGYSLLSDAYVNSTTKMSIKCNKGHSYVVKFNLFQQGRRCPTCKAVATSIRMSGHGNPQYGMVENLSPRWNIERTSVERNTERKTHSYTQFRNQVFERDKYSCVKCGDNTGGNLVVHHLFNHKDYPEVRVDRRNGVTLCGGCHKSFHAEYGYGENDGFRTVTFIGEHMFNKVRQAEAAMKQVILDVKAEYPKP